MNSKWFIKKLKENFAINKKKRKDFHLSFFFVGAHGFEPRNLPTYQSGCSEPTKVVIYLRLFLNLISNSRIYAADLFSNFSV